MGVVVWGDGRRGSDEGRLESKVERKKALKERERGVYMYDYQAPTTLKDGRVRCYF